MLPLSPENKLLLACMKIHPGKTELDQINELIPLIKNWNRFSLKMIERGFAPLFYKKWEHLSTLDCIPLQFRERMKNAYYRTLSRSMVFYAAFNQIAEELLKHSVPFIPLKGIYLSEWLYGDVGLRQFSDMDILVPPEDAKRTLLLLKSLGYHSVKSIDEQFKKNNFNLVHFSPMVLNNISVEVHIRLLNKERDRHHIIPEKLWENSETTLLSNQSIRVLWLHDLLIHVSMHLNKHMLSGTMQFTGWFDIVNLLEKYKSESDWNNLYERCHLFSCYDIVLKQVVLAKELMQANVPEKIYTENRHLLTSSYRKLFLKYLNGYKGFYMQDKGHLNTLIRIKPLNQKLSYLFDVVFPPKLYMVYKYKIIHEKLYILFYPYRWWLGMTGVFKMMMDK